jgi:hypothetical protein
MKEATAIFGRRAQMQAATEAIAMELSERWSACLK